MNEIIPFSYESTQVRVLDIDGEPWFVLADLRRVLGIKQFRTDRLDDDMIQNHPIADRLGRGQDALIVSESGMYEVILRSDAPNAKPFRRWVTSEVLPAIRKTGTYGTPQLTGPELMATALIEAQSMLEAKDDRIAELEPRAEYVETFVADEDLRLFRNVAKSLRISETTLRNALIVHEWIYREESSRWSNSEQRKVKIYRYSPRSQYARYFVPVPNHEAPRFKGEVHHTLKITPAGAVAIARILPRWGIATSTKEAA